MAVRNAYVTGKESGGVLIVALLFMAVGLPLLFYLKNQTDQLLAYETSATIQSERRSVAEQLQESIDCERTLAGYSSTSLCPEGTSVPILFHGDSTVDISGPDGSKNLGQGWYALATCGVQDLRVRVGYQSANGHWKKEPLTRRILDFSSPESLVSEKPGGLNMCSPWFGVGSLPAQIIGMSMTTQQYLGSEFRTPLGEMVSIGVDCSGRLNRMARMDDVPLDGDLCTHGPSGCPTPSSYTNYVNTRYLHYFASNGFPGNMQPDWFADIEFARHFGNTYCGRICLLQQGFAAGRQLTCDPTRAAGAFGTVYPNDPDQQVVCLCIK